jgi:hypothetical protein
MYSLQQVPFKTIRSPSSQNKVFLFYNTSLPWPHARKVCKADSGSDLATVSDWAEFNAILDAFSRFAEGAWIGLNDLFAESTFVWANKDSDTYRDWSSGEPNNLEGHEDCVQFVFNKRGWNDNNCDRAMYFLCHKIEVSSYFHQLCILCVTCVLTLVPYPILGHLYHSSDHTCFHHPNNQTSVHFGIW